MLSETKHDHDDSVDRADHTMPPIVDNLTGEEAPSYQDSGDRSEQAGASTSQVKCNVCGSTFRRPEHLKRHLRSHTKEKPFECAQCGRHFSRTDTLHRHELSHHSTGGEGGKDRPHRITVKTFRACFACATARVRCSGGMPCGRCETRSLDCHYPTERRSKARLRGVRTKRVADETQAPRRSPPRSEGKQADSLSQPSNIPAHQLGQFSITDMNEPPGTTKKLQASSHEESRVAAASSRESLNRIRKASSGRSQVAAPPLESAVGIEGHVTDATDFNQSGRSFGTEILGIDLAHSSELAIGFESTIFDQAPVNTIDWLPNELFLGNSSDHSFAAASPQQVLHNAPHQSPTTRSIWHPAIIEERNADFTGPMRRMHKSSNSMSSRRPQTMSRRFSCVDGEPSAPAGPNAMGRRSASFHIDAVNGGSSRFRKHQNRIHTAKLPSSTGHELSEGPSTRFCFPKVTGLSLGSASEEALRLTRPIQISVYEEIHRNFLFLCRNTHTIFDMFESECFPDQEECTQYLACYFDSFQAVYPIFHVPTFDVNQHHWILALAMMAIGCQIPKHENSYRIRLAFQEMLRRAIVVEKEKSPITSARLDVLQAMLLRCIGVLYNNGETERSYALGLFKQLVKLSEDNKLLVSISPEQSPEQASNEVLWLRWIDNEIRRRTGHCIWLVDCSLAYELDERPQLSLDDGQALLPASDKLWQCKSAEEWISLWDKHTVNQSLYDSVHVLYIEKKLAPGLSDFSYTLLIHALYHRMWEVGDYFRRPLSFWNPTAKKQSRETAIPNGSVWLPGIPSYSKWRNSACDCLEILHWTANTAVTGEIRSLATDLVTDRLQWCDRRQAIQWQYVWRWIVHDQYKARLSVIHAGAALWHVQQYSKDSFHEPIITFLAVLVLWAYGSCAILSSKELSPRLPPRQNRSLHPMRSIRLDRPCDDEQVQHFVRGGDSMKVSMTGIQDLCAMDGPESVLRLGCEILSSLNAWAQSKKYMAVLTGLASVMSHYSEAERSHDADMDGRGTLSALMRDD
ncbi:Fungal Zn(2)-Cys(6) binuclear cluster and zinc finger C2H2-type domain-containing protein [Penicillium ucsense]|uniref:Fungal Zn(2)-Cys(6) binuclear cluster and zinc finger C2H2-type domain-containing protein n=1 Tax=Penicillium ucsense TaxID=2839758 RepID=A0A8J8W8W4_9EURO|nr:Fungal Zn(2)-Cys(6) binuclear cluster and zinc finger C2H2-type domain-containing protein [Penicillium ucsense]KAF7739446.1 Fungal Zn(2)-Cys(6) binuclear cluster and zinc finger C2H2-type domain-containing protein [Penicillium ucsense]